MAHPLGYFVTERRDGRLMLGDEYVSPMADTLQEASKLAELARRQYPDYDIVVVELREVVAPPAGDDQGEVPR